MVDKETIKNRAIVLDYSEHRSTRFERCKLIYRGGQPPILIDNDFIECTWLFENEAQNTLEFLRGLAKGGGEDFVEYLLGLAKDAK